MHRFASVVLVDPRGWVLLQDRDEHARIDPDAWGFCGGHVEEGEAYESAAYRELAEETGVRLDGGLELWGEAQVFHTVNQTLDTVQLWIAASTLTDADIVCTEGRRIVFVDPATIGDLRLTTAAAQMLPDLLDSAAYRRLKEDR